MSDPSTHTNVLPEGCPTCGALPCDWTDTPKTPPVAESVDWDEVRAAVAKAAWPQAGLVDEAMARIRAAMPRPIEAEAGERRYAERVRLQEIADGAWGDGPFTRGAAKRELAALEAAHPTPTDTSLVGEIAKAMYGDDKAFPEGVYLGALHADYDDPRDVAATVDGTVNFSALARTALSKAKAAS